MASPTFLTLGGTSSISLNNSTTFEDSLHLSASNMYISACTLHGICQFTKTGSGVDQNVGPVNATNKVTYSNTSTGHFIIEGDFGDSYTDLVLENTSTGQLDFARRGASNTVSGQINIIISAGTVSLANLSTAQVSVSGNIGINSTGGTIIFGGLTHQIGGALSYTNLAGGLNLSRYTKLDSSPIDLLATGSANRLTLGASSSFNGKFKASFPSILIQGGVFADSLTLTKTGNSTDQGSGNLTCNGPASFTSTHSSGIWQINYSGGACVYHENVVYRRNGSGNFDFGFAGAHEFKKNLHIEGSHSFGATNNHFSFTGLTNQTISRAHTLSTSFLRLNVNKPSGELVIDLPLNVSTNLHLQKGNIKSTSSNSFGLSLNATLTGGSDSSYVEGPMTKAGTTAFTFPVGGGGVYAPLSIDAVASNTTFKVEYKAQDPDSLFSRAAKDSTIGFVNRCGYWVFDRISGTQHTTPTLGWKNNPCYSTNPIDASAALWDGSTWKDKGNAAYSGTSNNGSVKSSSTVTSYPAIMNLSSECNFYGLSYFSKPLFQSGDTIILKGFPEHQKSYSFFLSDSLIQQGISNTFIRGDMFEGDTIKTTIISLDGCPYTEFKVVFYKSNEHNCSLDIADSALSSFSSTGLPYNNRAFTCGCIGGEDEIRQSFDSDPPSSLTDRQRIQNFDIRTNTTYNPKPNFSPEKEISFNIVVIEDFTNNPVHGGNLNFYYDKVLERALKVAEEQYSGGTDSQQQHNGTYPEGMIKPSDPILNPFAESYGAKIKFKLNKIIHINNSTLYNSIISTTSIYGLLREKLLEQDCNYQKSINLILSEKRPLNSDSTIWGNASTPNCFDIEELNVSTRGTVRHTFGEDVTYGPLIELLNNYPNPNEAEVEIIQNALVTAMDFYDHQLAGHWAHEIGHNFDLFHTYDGNQDGLITGSGLTPHPETNIIDHFDFLSDVFAPNHPNGNTTFCDPPEGLVCYHQNNGVVVNQEIDGAIVNICGDINFATINDPDNPCNRHATNNIMGNFNIRFGYISPLQVAKVQRALSLKTTRKYVVGSPYHPTPIEITENETWAMDIQVYNDIVVKSGSTLKVTCRIAFPDQARLVVEPGAVLYIDGGTLTSFHKMWQGLRLLGNSAAPQGSYTVDGSNVPELDSEGYPIVSSSQGVVLMNNGTIENAREGIFIGSGFGGLEYDKTGGIVYANESNFKNNRRDVAFNPYKLSLKSKFIKCDFITDDHLQSNDYYNEEFNK